jgi:hypothetical protein
MHEVPAREIVELDVWANAPAPKQTREDEMWWWFGSILFLIIWIAIAFWPARVAARKGHSFLGFFILSLIFFPLSLILAYVVQDRTVRA